MLPVSRSSRRPWRPFLALVPAGVCLFVLSGCGEGDGKPATVDQAQAKKAQEYLGSYREQMVAEHKNKAKAKTAARKSN